MMQMMGDPSGEFTRECGMELTHPGPQSKGLYSRCKRFAMYVDNCIVKYVAVSERDDDPAGDAFPEATCAPAVIEAIKSLHKPELGTQQATWKSDGQYDIQYNMYTQ